MYMPWYEGAFGHYLAGITVSLADRSFSEESKRKTNQRMEKKLNELSALEYLVDEQVTDVYSSEEYKTAVTLAKDYFTRKGVSFESENNNKGVLEKLGDSVKYIRSGKERINNLPAGKKLAVAFGFEFAIDATVLVTQVIYGIGNEMTALGKTLYQAPCFFLGLQTGKGILYVKDSVLRSKDEKEMESIAKEMTKDGKVLQKVRNYLPVYKREKPVIEVIASEGERAALPLKNSELEQTVSNENSQGNKYDLTKIGENVGNRIVDAGEEVKGGITAGIEAVRKRLDDKKKAAEKVVNERKVELGNRYKDY